VAPAYLAMSVGLGEAHNDQPAVTAMDQAEADRAHNEEYVT